MMYATFHPPSKIMWLLMHLAALQSCSKRFGGILKPAIAIGMEQSQLLFDQSMVGIICRSEGSPGLRTQFSRLGKAHSSLHSGKQCGY